MAIADIEIQKASYAIFRMKERLRGLDKSLTVGFARIRIDVSKCHCFQGFAAVGMIRRFPVCADNSD